MLYNRIIIVILSYLFWYLQPAKKVIKILIVIDSFVKFIFGNKAELQFKKAERFFCSYFFLHLERSLKMSSSAECWEFSGPKLPEKPSFSQTCSRLSRYLKEKGSFGDLSFSMTSKPDVSGKQTLLFLTR